MSALFLKLARTVLFLSSSLHTFRLRMISSMVVLALWWRLPHTCLVCLLMLLFVLKFLPQSLLPNFVHLQRLESFVTDITGVSPLSLLCFDNQILLHFSFPDNQTLLWLGVPWVKFGCGGCWDGVKFGCCGHPNGVKFQSWKKFN